MTTLTHSIPASTVPRVRALPALLAVFFGIFLYVGTGFASPSMIHNATHDTRHALGLPCH